ncbi:MAG: (2Fe-2S)-binding protein [Anaerolineae bacterium]|nr:(2Fe-2S)-binding protein [Anaerolineae bacterium]
MPQIVLNINSEDYILEVEGNETLLTVLRERLDLTGAKPGCLTGDCGACKVIIDGKAENSCVKIAKNLVGKKIETIEGLSTPERLHPIQEAFIETGAVQCGYCTPGMIMSAKALLDVDPNPNDEEILAAIDGNICRCTGYVKIVDAIKLAAHRMSGGDQ